MSQLIDINQIRELLPHRYPFLLVDKVLDYKCDESIVAIKNVTMNEPFFQGHFPVQPVMPGVLIIEALAQAAGVLLFQSAIERHPEERNKLLLLAGVDNARFKRMVVPGDQLRLEVEFLKRRANIWKVKGVATVDGEVACSAELLSAGQ